ncbi:MAG: 16S rRNA (guanine(527)-N(7))-methyltransferase RsmG [Chloroflexi bacterium]|nr:16S rRNA (guanine(527)-N(7))-methyltransferase RsmG [Chloroflexota bacterium]
MIQPQRLANHTQALFDVTLDDSQLDHMAFYAREMLDWHTNRANLTGITEPEAVEIRHFLDSLSVLLLDIPSGARVADVGAGAGFPGLVLKIARPDLHVTLIESVGKKTAFLKHVVAALELADVDVLQTRAETLGQDYDYRESFDLVVARAVAKLPVLVEYMLPLSRVDGICCAMKGSSALAEVNDANPAIETLGGHFARMHSVSLPNVDEPHMLVIIEKVRMTPSAFPRRAGIPTKRPIHEEA